MNEQYLDAFVRESEDAITELNTSLLELETDPDDEEAMEQIFRTAHTLKGNFGAMGFEDAASLAHAVEDLLDAIRAGDLAVTPEVMDPVFAAVDEIEAAVAEIEETGQSTVDPAATIDQLRATLDAGRVADGASEGDATGEADTSPAQPPTDANGIDPGDVTGRLVHASVNLGETEMPGVDAMLVLEGIEGDFELVGTRPDLPAIEDGDVDEDFDVFVDAPSADDVAAALEALGDVEQATVTAVDDAATESVADGDHSVDDIKSVRVDVDQLDVLYGLVEQLVTSRIKLQRSLEDDDLGGADDTLAELDKITASLQNTVMDMRLIPLKTVVGTFPRMVRDLARKLDKEVEFEIDGGDIELDRTILTEMSDPLVHVVRNAVDHGIEPPDEREAQGKPRAGHVTLAASRERDHVVIEVRDDGAGLDVDELAETAIDTGVRTADEIESMDESAIYDLVFHPGFSTNKEVTDVSGRGVGMDVVHDTVTRLDGSVSVDSTPGEGTAVRVRLPVTMAIVKVLFVEVGDEEYGVPVKHVDEITRSDDTERLDGDEVVRYDDAIYPVVDLGEAFDVPGETATDGDGILVRIRGSERAVALRCDAVTAQEEVVVKPLEGLLSGTAGLSGTAVLGDGNLVHILDVVTL